MDFHLPAVTRYLAESTSNANELGKQRDALKPKDVSDVTALLSQQLTNTHSPPRVGCRPGTIVEARTAKLGTYSGLPVWCGLVGCCPIGC